MSADESVPAGFSRRNVIKKALRVGGAVYVAPVVLAATQPLTAMAAVTPVPTPLPSACNKPLERNLAPQGSGMAGTTQTTSVCPGTSGYRQTFQVSLTGAPANTSYDVYIDQDSKGSAASHIYAGTFTTDASGNAFFTASIIVSTPASIVDNEIVLNDPTRSNYTAHQFIQSSFTPCPVPC